MAKAFSTKGSIQPMELMITGKDGIRHATVVHAVALNDMAVVTLVDVSEQKKAEEVKRKTHERILSLLESVPAGLLVTDIASQRFVFANAQVGNMLGYSQPEILAMTLENLHRPEDLAEVRVGFENTLGQIQNVSLDVPFLRKDGKIVPVDLRHAFIDLDGRRCILSLLSDISERKRAEEEKDKLEAQLMQAQKLESIGRLAGGVAHDFNNHLQAILGFTELIMEGMDPLRPEYADLVEIQKAARYSADLTRQLLAFSRQQLAAPVVLDLNHVLNDLLGMIQRLAGDGIELIWKPSVRLDPVLMDPTQVNQILVNLCVNARDAMNGQGTLSIETGNFTCEPGFCALHAECHPGDYVWMRVSDTGCGMPPEVLEHIFEPFFSTKSFGQNSGLGLATVHGVVRQNNGFITVESRPGQGTTFQIYLPRCETKDAPKAAISRPAPAAGPRANSKETVILLDDEGSVLAYGQRMLARLGYTVLPARNAQEVLDLVLNHRPPIHLLVTDVIMPDMSGRELALQVAGLRPEIKFLFMSGFTAEQLARDGALDPDVFVLQKPFSGETLATEVRAVLDGPRPSR